MDYPCLVEVRLGHQFEYLNVMELPGDREARIEAEGEGLRSLRYLRLHRVKEGDLLVALGKVNRLTEDFNWLSWVEVVLPNGRRGMLAEVSLYEVEL